MFALILKCLTLTVKCLHFYPLPSPSSPNLQAELGMVPFSTRQVPKPRAQGTTQAQLLGPSLPPSAVSFHSSPSPWRCPRGGICPAESISLKGSYKSELWLLSLPSCLKFPILSWKGLKERNQLSSVPADNHCSVSVSGTGRQAMPAGLALQSTPPLGNRSPPRLRGSST